MPFVSQVDFTLMYLLCPLGSTVRMILLVMPRCGFLQAVLTFLLGVRLISSASLHSQSYEDGVQIGSALSLRWWGLLVSPGLTAPSSVRWCLLPAASLNLSSMLPWVTPVKVLSLWSCCACCVPRLFVGPGFPQPLSPWLWSQREFYCRDMGPT